MATTLTGASAKRIKKPGRYGAGGGLFLWVKSSGAKSWVLRVKVGGKRLDRGLGSIADVGLAEARRKAEAMRVQLRETAAAMPTAQATPSHRSPGGKVPVFREAVKAHLAQHKAAWRPSWAAQVEAELERHVLPTWGDTPVDAISQRDVLALLAPLFQRAPRTAARLRQRIRSVFRWAMSWEWIAANPAGEGIDGALPTARKATPRHYAALHYTDIEGAIAKVWQGPSRIDTKRAIVFTILTASRSGEVRFMTWRELSPDGRTWEIPAHRMKTGEAHRVPLSLQAQRVLAAAYRGQQKPRWENGVTVAWDVPPLPSALVFPGHYINRKPLSPRTMQAALETAGVLGTTPHGFRSSFRDWAAEQSRASHSAIELALSHKVGSTVEQAYFRSDLLEQRRELMQAWADYCAPSDDDAPASWERFSDVPIARNMPFFSAWSEQTLVPTSPPNLTKTRNFSLRFTLAL